MVFKFAGIANEATGSEEGLDEVDDAVGTAVLPLAVREDPVETPPFRGLAGVIFETSVLKGACDLVACPAVSKHSCERLDQAFRKWWDGIHS